MPFSTHSPQDESSPPLLDTPLTTPTKANDGRPSPPDHQLTNNLLSNVVAPSTPQTRTSAEGERWLTPTTHNLEQQISETEDEDTEPPNLSRFSPKSPDVGSTGLSKFFGIGRKKALNTAPTIPRQQIVRPRDFNPEIHVQLPTSRSLDYGRRDDFAKAGNFGLDYSKSLDSTHRDQHPRFLRGPAVHSNIDQRIQLASEDPSSPLRASFTDSPDVEMGARYLPSASDNAGDTQVNEIQWLMALDSISPRMARGDKKLRTLVKAGIADKLRGRIWRYLTDSNCDRVEGLYSVSVLVHFRLESRLLMLRHYDRNSANFQGFRYMKR